MQCIVTIICAEYICQQMLKGVGKTIGIVQFIPTSTVENMSIYVQYFFRAQCDIEKPPCILLLHVVFQTFSCRRRVLASCEITRTLSKSLLCST